MEEFLLTERERERERFPTVWILRQVRGTRLSLQNTRLLRLTKLIRGGERLGTVPPELTLSLSRGAEGCRFLAGSRIVFNLPYASRSPANSSLAYLYVRAYI